MASEDLTIISPGENEGEYELLFEESWQEYVSAYQSENDNYELIFYIQDSDDFVALSYESGDDYSLTINRPPEEEPDEPPDEPDEPSDNPQPSGNVVADNIHADHIDVTDLNVGDMMVNGVARFVQPIKANIYGAKDINTVVVGNASMPSYIMFSNGSNLFRVSYDDFIEDIIGRLDTVSTKNFYINEDGNLILEESIQMELFIDDNGDLIYRTSSGSRIDFYLDEGNLYLRG